METDKKNSIKYNQAKKRVKELKGFYWHFAIYLIINTFTTINKVMSNYYDGDTFFESIWNIETLAVWFFWGIGIAFHAMHVFGISFIFGKNWEEQKIKKMMEEDERQVRKYK